MISFIEGKVITLSAKYLIVFTNGLGYKIAVAPGILAKARKDESVSLFTHLVVREDALELFGFETKDELEFFETLISISGIGPRSALGIIGIAPIATLKRGIAGGDLSYLTKVSGIGKKTAEKIILELRDKIKSDKEGPELKIEVDALEALYSLGYSKEEAREALKKVPDAIAGTEARVKEALKVLAS